MRGNQHRQGEKEEAAFDGASQNRVEQRAGRGRERSHAAGAPEDEGGVQTGDPAEGREGLGEVTAGIDEGRRADAIKSKSEERDARAVAQVAQDAGYEVGGGCGRDDLDGLSGDCVQRVGVEKSEIVDRSMWDGDRGRQPGEEDESRQIKERKPDAKLAGSPPLTPPDWRRKLKG